MTAALFVGLAFGAGILLIASGLRPAPVPLGKALAQLERTGDVTVVPMPGLRRCGRALTDALADSGPGRRMVERMASDLRIVGMSPSEYLGQRFGCALVALLWAPVTTALAAACGVAIPVTVPLWASVVLAPVGFLYPSLKVRALAASLRRTFRHALSSFLDVVSIGLAAGRGVESALYDGLEAGRGWPFDELRQALLEARLHGEAPWAGLGRLGAHLGVPELRELAASASLAGAEGARVRTSLAAKARSMRQRSLADVEAAAAAASERMSIPVVLLMAGFVVFLGFPALRQVLDAL